MGGDILPLSQGRACSGKCKAPCGVGAFVLAACEGMVAPCYMQIDGTLTPLEHTGRGVLLSWDEIRDMLQHGFRGNDPLLLVGSPVDIAWLRAALPLGVDQRVSAEIAYPLMPAWFSAEGRTALVQALEHVLK